MHPVLFFVWDISAAVWCRNCGQLGCRRCREARDGICARVFCQPTRSARAMHAPLISRPSYPWGATCLMVPAPPITLLRVRRPHGPFCCCSCLYRSCWVSRVGGNTQGWPKTSRIRFVCRRWTIARRLLGCYPPRGRRSMCSLLCSTQRRTSEWDEIRLRHVYVHQGRSVVWWVFGLVSPQGHTGWDESSSVSYRTLGARRELFVRERERESQSERDRDRDSA